MADDRETWKRICQKTRMLSTRFTGRTPPLQAFLRQLVGDLRRPKTFCKKCSFRYGLGRTGFGQSAGLFVAYLYGIARKRAAEWWRKQGPSDRETENKASVCQTETDSIMGDALRRLPRNNENCRGYVQWKGDPMRNSQ